MKFDWNNAWYLLPPLLAAAMVWRFRGRGYYGHPLAAWLASRLGPAPVMVHLPRVLEFLSLAVLSLALLDPKLPFAEQVVRNEGLNMALVLDLSSSMQMPVTGGRKKTTGGGETRLDAVKRAMIEFIQRRKGDRIGIVVFSNNAYVVSPLTMDYDYLVNYVRLIDDKTLSDEGMTAIGEGLILARDLLYRFNEDQRKAEGNQASVSSAAGGRHGNVIVLLTDGENNYGRPVAMAIDEVRQMDIKTYFIGVEVVMGATVHNQGFNDAPAIIAGVHGSGGRYYDVRDAAQLNQAYRDIHSLEKGKFLTKTQLRDVPGFRNLALLSFLLLAAGLLLRNVPAFRELS